MLAVLKYYTRLYEAIPGRVWQAGAGSFGAVQTEARAATDTLMKQHRDALARCKATIELAEQMISEQEARYRTALATLNGEALDALSRRAANRIARVAGNRLVGAVALAAREQRQRLDAALASFELPSHERKCRLC